MVVRRSAAAIAISIAAAAAVAITAGGRLSHAQHEHGVPADQSETVSKTTTCRDGSTADMACASNPHAPRLMLTSNGLTTNSMRVKFEKMLKARKAEGKGSGAVRRRRCRLNTTGF